MYQQPHPGQQAPPQQFYGIPPPPGYGYVAPGHPAGPINPMQPPMVQAMIPDTNLAIYPTIVIRQVTQWGEILAQAVGIPYEQANKYKISAAPPGAVAASSMDDPQRWKLDHHTLFNLPPIMHAVEESSVCDRIMLTACGCLNLRAFTMHFNDLVNQEKFRLERPCKCGAWCCCPLELTVKSGASTIGRVEEDCSWCSGRCYEACCTCTTYARVLELEGSGSYKHTFTTRTSLCCCGRVNNCCGATCCKDVLVIDVLDPGEDKILTHINKVYAGGGGCAACCRMVQDLNNYVVSFTPGMSLNQRMLLLGALQHINYQVFEKTGDENNGD